MRLHSKPRKRLGFQFTPIPHTMFDWLAKELTPVEFVVYACICRKTWGFGKDSDRIAVSQLVQMSGVSRRSVQNALKRLFVLGLIMQTGNTRSAKQISPQTRKLILLSGASGALVGIQSGASGAHN